MNGSKAYHFALSQRLTKGTGDVKRGVTLEARVLVLVSGNESTNVLDNLTLIIDN